MTMPNESQLDKSAAQALIDSVHQELRTSFMASMPGRLDEIRRLAGDTLQASADPQSVRDLHAATHRLAGTSAVYGLRHTSAVTRRFNRLLMDRMEAGLATIGLDALEAFLRELDAALAQDQ
jgi:chemotaxis protein histidine kinase CheA